jgi:hypothetical protein
MYSHSMKMTLPGLKPADEHPLEVHLDYWGRNPSLQVLCYDHDDNEGEPKVKVRYNTDGKVVEVIVADNLRVFTDSQAGQMPTTPWETDREANPACIAGDKLKMPSGQVATVMSLRDRYDHDIEQFRAYDATYGILDRLDGFPGMEPRRGVYTSIEQAWDVNPLTAGTADPSDFSFVPTQTSAADAT